jgi:hypothetical protein
MQRLDIGELADLVLLAPGEEPTDRGHVGGPGVPVADGGGEECQEPVSGMLAGIGDDAGPFCPPIARRRALGSVP